MCFIYLFLFFIYTFLQILLSNDKNLCNKAIVSGIKAYQKAEMQQALEELSSESEDQIRIQCSSGNGKIKLGIHMLQSVSSKISKSLCE
jgi:hypothetical protein